MDFCVWEGIGIQTLLKATTDSTVSLIVTTINLNVLKIKNNDTSYINIGSNKSNCKFVMLVAMGVVWIPGHW